MSENVCCCFSLCIAHFSMLMSHCIRPRFSSTADDNPMINVRIAIFYFCSRFGHARHVPTVNGDICLDYLQFSCGVKVMDAICTSNDSDSPLNNKSLKTEHFLF